MVAHEWYIRTWSNKSFTNLEKIYSIAEELGIEPGEGVIEKKHESPVSFRLECSFDTFNITRDAHWCNNHLRWLCKRGVVYIQSVSNRFSS